MTQAPEDFPTAFPERPAAPAGERPRAASGEAREPSVGAFGDAREPSTGTAPLVPGQRPAPERVSPGPVLPQAEGAPQAAAFGEAREPSIGMVPPLPEPTAPPSALPVDMRPPGMMAPPTDPVPHAGAPIQPATGPMHAPMPGRVPPGTVPPGPVPLSAMPPWPGGYYAPPPPSARLASRQSAGPERSRLLTVFTVVALVAASVFGGALASGWRPSFAEAETGTFEDLAVEPDEGTIPSPGEDATDSEVLAYVKEQAQLVLDAQSESLLNGSLDGWLAAYDPTLHDQMTGRFDSLTSMQVSRFDYAIASGPIEDSSGTVSLYDISISLSYCFVEPADTCKAADIVFDTRWRVTDDGVIMVEVSDSESSTSPHPWEATELVAAVGERTVTAVPVEMADRLDEALEVAEAAAANADEWALWEKPDRYVVYIAGDEEFEVWFGGMYGSEDVLGFALSLDGTVDGERRPSTYATVMGVDRTGWGEGLTSVIRHELGHAATLWAAESQTYTDDTWWMVEGVAEYIDQGDRAIEDYDRIWDVRDYVAQGGCAEDILPPDQDDDTLAGSGKYGCGYLGVSYVVDTYGIDAFAEFFGMTVRDAGDANEASQTVFGKDYAVLMEEITAFIAQTV